MYTLKQASLGAIASERTMTSWSGTTPTSWNDQWYHYDRLGNVVTLSNSSAGIVAQFEQEAFGNVVSGSAAGYHLTTKEYDSDAGVSYFGARWYDPGVGRFLEPDPLVTGAVAVLYRGAVPADVQMYINPYTLAGTEV